MPRFLLLLVTVLAVVLNNFALASSDPAPPTFYVSPTGSDKNNGTLPEAAWQTLAAASARLPVDGPGWNLLLERNGVWINDPLSVKPTAAADTPAWFSVGAYGDPFQPLPLLMHVRGLTNLGHTCVLLGDVTGNLTVQDLHMSGCARGLVVSIDGAETVAPNVTIQRNTFLDIRTPLMRYTPPNPMWAPAIMLEGGKFKNLVVRNNIAARIDVFFSSVAECQNMLLDSNTVQQCSGNCYNMGRGYGLTLRNSVFLRDMSERLFLYGTTDVIVGSIVGDNSLIDNDFNQRGEYQGGPDGCAFDFETGATGFLVQGNTFYRSWGSGIMIFGHAQTSHNITIADNTFAYAGCVQNRADRGGIAVMCPNDQKPTGNLIDNAFYTCPGVPAMYVNPHVPGCADELNMVNNTIDGDVPMVEMPQLSYNPPSPDDTATYGVITAIAVTTTPNATIRYTYDGSRPTENSPIVPEYGLLYAWPGPVVAINIRAFADGMRPSVTNGALLELNYVFGRESPRAGDRGPTGAFVGGLGGNLDAVSVSGPGNVTVAGWAVDTMLPGGGVAPVTVTVAIDGTPVASVLATGYRPDLVKAHVAPNPDHGFVLPLPAAAASSLLAAGRHVIQVNAIGSPSAVLPSCLPDTCSRAFCDGRPCT